MSTTKVSMQFGTTFQGTLKGDKTTINVGRGEGEVMPYEMLLGALGACFYATFQAVADKMRLTYEGVEMNLEGTKREEEPAYLINTKIVFNVLKGENKEKLTRAAELAKKYCSVYYTLSQVSEMELELNFV